MPTLEVLQLALNALKENHEWHRTYDDHTGYPESALENQNLAAINALTAEMQVPPSTVSPMSQPNRLIAYLATDKLRALGYIWSPSKREWLLTSPIDKPHINSAR